jgi:RND family efflux transporter MFP subunit
MTVTPGGPDISGLRIQREAPPADAPRRRGRWPLYATLLILAGLGAAAYLLLAHRPRLVETSRPTVTRQDPGNEVLTATGYVVSRHQAQVGSKVLGRVEKLLADEGERVRAGQELATLDTGDLPAQLSAIEVNLPQARNDLSRQEELMKRGLTTQSALETAQTRVRTLEAQASVIRAQLEQFAIRAPFAGTVILRNLELGETISPTGFTNASSADRGFVVADLTDLEVEADVNESRIAELRAGQPARVELDGLPGKSMSGRLRMIQPTANRQKATVQSKVTILNPDPGVRPDMTARVTFLRSGAELHAASAQPRIYVSAAAVARRGSEEGVWIIEDGVLKWRPVTTGEAAAGQREVTRGLEGQETVVEHPATDLKEGMAVKPKPAAQE